MPSEECKGNYVDIDEGKFAEEKGTDREVQQSQRQDSTPHLELLSMDCGPSDCPVGERLELSMEFTLDRSLGEASWEIKFLVDSVNERHTVRLGATRPRDYAQGTCSMHFEVPSVPVEDIKPCTLANTGLLVAILRGSHQEGGRGSGEKGQGDDEVATVNLVVQVADVGQGRLRRVIYSPLE